MTINSVTSANDTAAVENVETNARERESGFTSQFDEETWRFIDLAISESDKSEELILQNMKSEIIVERTGREERSGEHEHIESVFAPQNLPLDLTGSPQNKQIAQLEFEIGDLNQQADALESLAADHNDPNAANDLLNRAEALRGRADSLSDRIEVIEDRMAIEGNREGHPTSFDDPYTDHAQKDAPVFDPPEVVEEYQTQISSIDGFESLEVTDTRSARVPEIDLLLSLASEQGASPEQLELVSGFEEMFPLQFVFAENLASDFGYDVAAGGEFTLNGTSTIVMDAKYKDADFTTLSKNEDPQIAALGLENVEFGMNVVLEVFDLPGHQEKVLNDLDFITGLSETGADDE